MIQQSPTQSEFEKKIRDEAEKTPCITFGYIGNFERWGDDRMLFLWISNQRHENGNQKDIWSCNARELDRQTVAGALYALRRFREGYEAAKKEWETNTEKQHV